MIVNDLKAFIKEMNNNVFIVGGVDRKKIDYAIKKIYDFSQSNGYDLRIIDFELSSFDDIKNACFTSTFFLSKKLVHVKNFELIKVKGEDEKSSLDNIQVKDIVELIKNLDTDTILLLSYDGQIDLTNQISKIVSEIGCVANFSLTKQDLPLYIDKILNKEYKRIGKAEINYFLESINYSTEQIYNELEKLIDYTMDETRITIKHIDDIVTKTLESNIFKMVDSIGKKEAHIALSILNNLINQKEPELKILGMIIRQFRLLYLMKIIDERHKGMIEEEILKKLSLDARKKFIIRNLRIQNQRFNKQELIRNINLCLDTDYKIKSGNIQDGKLALELLILNICK
ncbi:DNA polymerase III, delta subunit [Caloramator fervidus]|uniref:DNA polymerase III subunit delta n=1 Tax=Caloramator fervidus TaxID=29344 RepID=A0A1H5UI81_9CLOT|nr:DNA polymerase III subunit delta [Caloramator fervidus]SEF74734.1 DNA polymerase III, delta subunit [Caloramator fervidus]